MFDNAPSAKLGKRLGHKQNIAQSGSIYSELKLSDQLNSTLEKVRSEVQSLTESLEIEVQRRMALEGQYKALKLKYK